MYVRMCGYVRVCVYVSVLQAAHPITDHVARAVSEIGYHTILGGDYDSGCSIEQVLSLIGSLRLIEVRFMLRLLPEIMLDFKGNTFHISSFSKASWQMN